MSAPGKLWEDADPRILKEQGQRRRVRIESVEGDRARVLSWYERPATGAVGVTVWERRSAPRPSTIRLDRFKPNRTGYRLVEDAPEETS